MTDKAKSFGAAMGAISVVLTLAAIFLALPSLNPDSILVLVLLALVGNATVWLTQTREQDSSHWGYLSPALFLGFFPLAFQPSLTGLLPWQRLGQGIVVLTAAHLTKILSSGRHGLAVTGVNLLRLVSAGGAYVLINHFASTFAGRPVVAPLAAMFILLLFDQIVTNGMMNSNEDEENQKVWSHTLERLGKILPAQAVLGFMAAAFADSILAEMKNDRVAAAFGAVFGSFFATLLNVAVCASSDELALESKDTLEVDLKKAQYNAKALGSANQELTENLEKKSSELELIYDMARSLGASTNLSETMSIVQSMIRRLRIPYQSCVIYLHKSGRAVPGQALTAALADTPYREVLEMSGLLQLQEPLITQVLTDQRPQMAVEMTTAAEQRIFKDEKSVICVPLVVSKENIGVIYVGSIHARTHKEEHMEKLKMLAAYAAPAIKTALLFEQKDETLDTERKHREAVEAKNRQLAGLQQLGQAIGATLKIDNTLKVVANSLQQMLPQAQSVILFATSSEDPHSLKAEFAMSPYGDYVRNLPVRNDEGLLGNATKQNVTLLVQDTAVYDHQNIINNERSVIVAPLTSESDVMGCLYVGAQKEGTFNEEHRSLVETVSYQAAIALKNAKLYEQTQLMALTDGLTGLYTHRYFQVRLADELEWSDRSGKPICLVMVDTDKFKQYNDTLGHPAGDSLLKDIAGLLKDKVRASDVVCRYGGDEFALILKDSPKEKAMATCERIRETFQLRFAAAAVQVTSSIGVACYPTDARDKKDLAQAADAALYVSKKTGRNKVTAAPTMEEAKQRPPEKIEPLPR